jgi:hypothetical protein
MPSSVGPNTFGEENLVFGYDLGDVRNSYKGEPTVNLLPAGVAFGHNSGGYGNSVTVVDAPEKGPGWKKVTISNRGTNFRIIQWTYLSMLANTTYCFSAEFDWGNLLGKGYSLNHDGSGTGVRNFYLPNNYSSSLGSAIQLTAGRPAGVYAGTITHTVAHTHSFFLNNPTTNVSGLNDYFYYRNFQVEANSHPTPYTTGTRSATQGLLDLTGNSTINLSNVSFDSNAQVDFDGSDDYASLGNPTVLRDLTSGTIETVYYRDASTGTYQMIFTDAGSDLEITYSGNVLQFYIGNSGLNYTHAVTGQWFHVAGTWDASSKKIYLNGVEVASGTNTGIDTGNRDRYVGGRGTSFPFNGKIPMIKVYTRTLTASEVKSNFNAIKGRFSIL